MEIEQYLSMEKKGERRQIFIGQVMKILSNCGRNFLIRQVMIPWKKSCVPEALYKKVFENKR